MGINLPGQHILYIVCFKLLKGLEGFLLTLEGTARLTDKVPGPQMNCGVP